MIASLEAPARATAGGSGATPDGDLRGRRVVVAMSGGVDSSVAAALLARAGARVVGITMKNFCYAGLPETSSAASCCSLQAIEDARGVADRLGFPHYVLDFEAAFGRAVVDDFVAEYGAGRTPNPCVRCNRLVRFPHLHARARALGAELVATGHYARVEVRGSGPPRLLRGADPEKDQSYYLWGLAPALLARTRFPVGGLRKPRVREIAADLGLEVAEKPESMEVCFVPDGDLRGFLEREATRRDLPPGALRRFRPGPVLSTTGELLGEHRGSAFYTVGQRRGLGVAAGEPRYVVALRGPNTVVLGRREDLLARAFEIAQTGWIERPAPGASFGAEIQIRHRQRPVRARIRVGRGATAWIEADEPLSAVAPGQSAVIYDGDRVLGGGVIQETSRDASAGDLAPASREDASAGDLAPASR